MAYSISDFPSIKVAQLSIASSFTFFLCGFHMCTTSIFYYHWYWRLLKIDLEMHLIQKDSSLGKFWEWLTICFIKRIIVSIHYVYLHCNTCFLLSVKDKLRYGWVLFQKLINFNKYCKGRGCYHCLQCSICVATPAFKMSQNIITVECLFAS